MTTLKEARANDRDARKLERLKKYAEKGVERAVKALEAREPEATEEKQAEPKKKVTKKTGGKK